jgi:UDP-glucose 4-epimerase
MRIIVTGGSGFIGSRLVAELCSGGHAIRVVDPEPCTVPGVAWYPESVLDAAGMRRVIRSADVVVHLAGPVRDGMRRAPYQAGTLQVQGTLNVLEACRSNGVPHLLFASSFYVYHGLPDTPGVDETAAVDTRRMELFGAAKLLCEGLCREYTRQYDLQHTILRLGSAYGPGGSNVVRAFVEAGLQGRVLEVWGRGERRNQYTYVGDLARGIAAALHYPNETFNLIAPEVTTTAALAEMLGRALGVAVHYEPSRSEESSLPYMNSGKAMTRLSWQPTSLHEGLTATIQELRTATPTPA